MRTVELLFADGGLTDDSEILLDKFDSEIEEKCSSM